MQQLFKVDWDGGIPGYADITPTDWVVSVPNRQALHHASGAWTSLPEKANQVALSLGGKWAWQGHESGLVYAGLVSTNRLGYGQNSFLYVGEELRVISDVATYQATAGGWRYVDQAGQLVSYGATYSGPPLWEFTDFGDVRIGQGPENADGICLTLAGGVVRQLVPGEFHNIRVKRQGEHFFICAVNYPEHYSLGLHATLADFAAAPFLTPLPPIVIPVPNPPMPTYDAKTPSTWTDAQLKVWIAEELAKARSTDDPDYWFKVMREASKGNDADYWAYRISIGDGAGRATTPSTPPPTPEPTPAPIPDPRVEELMGQVATLTAQLEALKLQVSALASLVATKPSKGDPIEVTGTVSAFGFSKTITSHGSL